MSERFKIISAAHVLVLQNDTVLLLKRHNTGYEDGNYSVPAGHHDPGESMSQTAIRELAEETGISFDPQDLEFGCVMHRIKPTKEESIDYFFIARRWSGQISICEPDHCSELDFFPLNALPENVIPHIREAINASLEQRHFVEFGF